MSMEIQPRLLAGRLDGIAPNAAENGCVSGWILKDSDMAKAARNIRLKEEGNAVADGLSRPPVKRLRAVHRMRGLSITADAAPGKQGLSRGDRVVKLK